MESLVQEDDKISVAATSNCQVKSADAVQKTYYNVADEVNMCFQVIYYFFD